MPDNTRTCAYPACGKPHQAKGLCAGHYQQQSKGRELAPLRTRAKRGDGLAWITAAVSQGAGTKCIIFPWQTGQTVLQPMLKFEGHYQSVGAIALQIDGRPRPKDQHARHDPTACNNPKCVNPNHLTWGTRSQNMTDREIAGTNGWDHRGELTIADVQEIRRLIAENNGLRQHEIGARFGVGGNAVSNIKHGRAWAWLTPDQTTGEPPRPWSSTPDQNPV